MIFLFISFIVITALLLWKFDVIKKIYLIAASTLKDKIDLVQKLTISEWEALQIFESSGVPMRVVDRNFNTIRVNNQFAKTLGKIKNEIKGQTCYSTFPGQFCNTPECTLRRILNGEKRVNVETIKYLPNGKNVSYEIIATPYYNFKGEIVGMVESFHDLTKAKEQEALRENIERLSRHDLKTPLNGIIGFPQVLIEADNITQEQKVLLKRIEEAGYRMLNLINLTLSLYKMENRTYVLSPKPIDLIAIIDSVLKELKNFIDAKKIKFDLSDNSAQLTLKDSFQILGEEILFYSLWANLIKNAVEASPEGETISIKFHIQHSELISITISNKGEVPQTIRHRFFEKYVTAGKVDGNGLGTYLARLVIETHGGTIALDTSIENVTTISFSLPMKVS